MKIKSIPKNILILIYCYFYKFYINFNTVITCSIKMMYTIHVYLVLADMEHHFNTVITFSVKMEHIIYVYLVLVDMEV